MEDYNDEVEDVPTIDYEEFKGENLVLLQRPKKALVKNISWGEEHEDFYNIHTLFMSGYLNRDNYNVGLMESEQDLDSVELYEIINYEHSKKIRGERIVQLQVNRDELVELLNNKLKNNHFTILLFLSELSDDDFQMPCLIFKNKEGEIKVIQLGQEEPFVTTLEEFFDDNVVVEEDICLFAIIGRNEGKKELQKCVLQIWSKKPASELSKIVFDYANPHQEYSPLRKKKNVFKK